MGRDVKLGLLQDILTYCGESDSHDAGDDSHDQYWATSLKLEMYEFGRLCEAIERDRLAEESASEMRSLRRAR